jgi:hypothetical protein
MEIFHKFFCARHIRIGFPGGLVIAHPLNQVLKRPTVAAGVKYGLHLELFPVIL